MRGTIFTRSGQFVCFADDVDIIGRNRETVADLCTRLKREASRVGLKINESKQPDNDSSREIRRRIICGSRAYYGLHKTLRSRKLYPRTKYTIYKTLIRPVVLYGHETWTMLEEDLQALEVFERRVLRTIFGGVQ